MKDSILSLIYPDGEIFIKSFSFAEKELSVRVSCLVPAKSYVKNLIPYVTAENYLRCLSQASYILAHHILKNKLIPIDVDEESFLKAMIDYELYYRNVSMTFHQRSRRGEEFEMELSLKNFREIKNLKDYILFTFSNKKAVISGDMSFVFLK
ncbi:MAG: hypothetical protein V4665_01640 [Patescibacteria group bacterium]